MAQNPTPELYLSLLSGRYGTGDVSHILSEQRHNDVRSRTSGRPFPNDPNRVMDLLDALAAICIRKENGEVFFVSLAMDSDAATLYVSSNEPVPTTVISHLQKIRGQVKALKSLVVEFDPSIPLKLRRRFLKRAPAILAQYDATMEGLQANNTSEDTRLLISTRMSLQKIHSLLQDEKPPRGPPLTYLIQSIDLLSLAWRNHLKAVGDKDILVRWDHLIRSTGLDQNGILSLRRFLQKLFTLNHHIHTITRIAWSRRLSPLLGGQFNVVSVPAARGDISIKFAQQNIIPVIFPPRELAERNIKLKVYDELLKRLRKQASKEGIEMKEKTVPELSMKVNVHAEFTLLAYHLQHPEIHPYRYFGGSKLSCHGCGTLFTSFNLVAESFSLPQFFTRGCHNKIYLRWPCHSLLSPEQQIRSRHKDSSLDTEVRKGMVAILSSELAAYVHELCVDAEAPSRPQSDGTVASGDSHESRADILERMDAMAEADFAFNPST